ncbi:DUF6457 domain-containing protein [Corynebacterium mayonis]|uniref:DUF6457 domain-containing protein n=1 Tax=Corynebacterium mayonis TaxID=3062461 RepID=UPI00314068D7
MPESDSPSERLNSTHAWLHCLSEAFGVSPEITRQAVGPVLDMTARVAHNGPARPAAPTTAFLVGLAAGRAAGGGAETNAEVMARVEELIDKVDELLAARAAAAGDNGSRA